MATDNACEGLFVFDNATCDRATARMTDPRVIAALRLLNKAIAEACGLNTSKPDCNNEEYAEQCALTIAVASQLHHFGQLGLFKVFEEDETNVHKVVKRIAGLVQAEMNARAKQPQDDDQEQG